MRYKINEVSKITNIPVDTLRYYEKIGVISPKIDAANHYRYYEAWDINFLFDYTNYRKMDYSSKEALRFIHGASLSDQIKMLKTKKAYYEERRNRYQMLIDRSSLMLEAVENIQNHLGKIDITNIPAYKYILYREDYDFYEFEHFRGELNPWFKQIELTDNIIIVPRKNIEDKAENHYHWGLLLREEWFKKLPIPETESVKYIPSTLCLRTLIEAGGPGTFHYHLLDFAMDYIHRHAFKLSGDPFGLLLIRSHEDGCMHRYFEFYLPITEA